MNDQLDSIGKEALVAYLKISTIIAFEWIEETMRKQGQYSHFVERVSNTGPSE
jgi:hypothetical protein